MDSNHNYIYMTLQSEEFVLDNEHSDISLAFIVTPQTGLFCSLLSGDFERSEKFGNDSKSDQGKQYKEDLKGRKE